jgi:hypothetical protein
MPKKSKLPDLVTDDEANKWVWEIPTPLLAAASGDIAALFKAEGVDTPGFLNLDAPSSDASLFAREAIQNSWDAARELKAERLKKRKPVEPFYLEFTFKEVQGFDKRSAVYALGLDEHSRQFRHATAGKSRHANLGLADTGFLNQLLDSNVPLRVLTMSEHAGLGMPGSFVSGSSRMLQALLRVGYTVKAEGAGGSFGYGKAGLIAASSIRTVVAYTAFEATDEEPRVDRRLLGVTYWKPHKIKSTEFNGWARLGKRVQEGTLVSALPFDNDDADEAAAKLGLKLRDPSKRGETGTTFLIVDPTITANDLRLAIERYWWPAMLDATEGLKVRITDYDGSVIVPSVPMNDPDMRPFIRGFQLATKTQDAHGDNEARISLGSYKPQGSDTDYTLGQLGVVADPQGWSFPEGDEVDHCTLVALIRGPRMVVNYQTFRNLGIPYVRGTLVADAAIDDLLRQTEDKAHTKWETRKLAGTDPHSSLVAHQVQARLSDKVREFKNRFKKPAPRPGDLNLPILDELSRLMKGKKPKMPDPERRQVEIRLVTPAHVVPQSDGRLVCSASVEFSVADWVWPIADQDSVEVSITLSIAFVEDEKLGDLLAITAKSRGAKFKLSDEKAGRLVFVGTLKPDQSVTLDVTSAAYSPDWTVRFTPTAAITDPVIKARRGLAPKDPD